MNKKIGVGYLWFIYGISPPTASPRSDGFLLPVRCAATLIIGLIILLIK